MNTAPSNSTLRAVSGFEALRRVPRIRHWALRRACRNAGHIRYWVGPEELLPVLKGLNFNAGFTSWPEILTRGKRNPPSIQPVLDSVQSLISLLSMARVGQHCSPFVLQALSYPASAPHCEEFPIWLSGITSLLDELKPSHIEVVGCARRKPVELFRLIGAPSGSRSRNPVRTLDQVEHFLDRTLRLFGSLSTWRKQLLILLRTPHVEPEQIISSSGALALCLRARQLGFLTPLQERFGVRVLTYWPENSSVPSMISLGTRWDRVRGFAHGLVSLFCVRLELKKAYRKLDRVTMSGLDVRGPILTTFWDAARNQLPELEVMVRALRRLVSKKDTPFTANILVSDPTATSTLAALFFKDLGLSVTQYFPIDDGLPQTQELNTRHQLTERILTVTERLATAMRARRPENKVETVGLALLRPRPGSAERIERKKVLAEEWGLDVHAPWWLLLSRHVSDPVPLEVKKALFIETHQAARASGALVLVRPHPHESKSQTTTEATHWACSPLTFSPDIDLRTLSGTCDLVIGPEVTSALLEAIDTGTPVISFEKLPEDLKARQPTSQGNAAAWAQGAAIGCSTADQIRAAALRLKVEDAYRREFIEAGYRYADSVYGPHHLDTTTLIYSTLRQGRAH